MVNMGKVMEVAVLQGEYIKGLGNLRKRLHDVECDLDKVRRAFYCCERNDDDLYGEYLKTCNDKLLHCNNKLRNKNIDLEVIDSELKFVALLNKLRDLGDDVEPEVTGFLTKFWEQLKTGVESLVSLGSKFQTGVLKSLESSCISYGHIQDNMELTKNYTRTVKEYHKQIQDVLQRLVLVAKTFTSGISQELFSKSSFTDKVLVVCDQKAFPILRLFPDLSEKLVHVCSLACQWIDKDETYVHDLSSHIREARNQTRKKEKDLRTQWEKHSQMSKTVEEAQELFKTNKKKLAKIEKELKTIEAHVIQATTEKQYKLDEKRQKEGMVGFLDISITQTKKNMSLHLKKSRMLRHLKDLEEGLRSLEEELSSMEEEAGKKTEEKTMVAEKVEETKAAYVALKDELEKFTEDVDNLQQELNGLTESLTQLEIIQSFKTSPEKLEDFYDHPPPVKLAPSLKDKIKRKRTRKHLPRRR